MIAGLVDRATELLDGMLRNKLRTALTAAAVAWGIFVLVLLLGLGRGLENNVRWMYRDDALNSIWVYRGVRTIPHAGHPVGARIRFTNRDHALLEAQLADFDHLSSRYYPPVGGMVRWNGAEVSGDFRAVHPDHRYIAKTTVTRGRFLDERDLAERRKVAVVGEEVVRSLFRGADPVGEWVEFGGAMFQVVGTFQDGGGQREESQIYLPLSTAQASFGGTDQIHQLMFTLDEGADAATAEAEVRALLGRAHHIAPADRRALRVRNNLETYERVQGLFDMLGAFVWVVGLGTVGAGVVGVSNILLVSVKERTAEIGLRKALGATPASIVWMIVAEALLVTTVAGYSGLVAGVLTLEALRRWMPPNDYLRDPDIDVGAAVVALLVVIVAGTVAGLIPAVRAASLDPIAALREE